MHADGCNDATEPIKPLDEERIALLLD